VLVTEVTDLSILDFVLLIEIAIADPISPVLSNSSKNILKKFPSWTKLYSDAEDQTNQNQFVPESTGGKFINSVLLDNLDSFDTQVDIHNINRFIGTADLDQIASMYSSLNVPNTFSKVYGDDVELTKIDEISNLYEAKNSDYVYYHNPINRQIITIQKFNSIKAYSANSGLTMLSQAPMQRFNWFDEYGARVGLNRLYLESNSSFKFRILDVFKNPISSNISGFKRTLRRELDLWTAFGSTPDHVTQYATPTILEMSDIESSSEFFYADGNPKQKFIDLVRNLNEKYPTHWGYFKFSEALWDATGENQEGVDRISSRYYDDSNDLTGIHYQTGVGDLSDAEVIVLDNSATPTTFQTRLIATGKRKVGTNLDYAPVKVEYEYYSKYNQVVYDNNLATVNLTLEGTLTSYGSNTSDTDIYTTIIRYVKNQFSPTSSASPEFHEIKIFDTEGFTDTDLELKRKSSLQPLVLSFNGAYTSSKIPYTKIKNLKLKNGLWNGTSYATPNSDSFSAMFSHKPNIVLKSSTSEINASTPNFNMNTSVKIVSNLYTQKISSFETVRTKNSLTINDSSTPSTTSVSLPLSQIKSSIIYPPGATPVSIHVESLIPYTAYDSPGQSEEDTISIYGGVSNYSEIDRDIFIPASPNIIASVHRSAQATNNFGYIGSTNSGATANYYFGRIEYPVSATPDSIIIKTANSSKYPFTSIQWDPFEKYSTPITNSVVDENGVIRYSVENGERIPGLNNNIVDLPTINRETFGISGAGKFDYFFENIKVIDPEDINVSVWSDQKVVKPFLNRTYVLENSIADAINNKLDHIEIIQYPLDSIVETYDAAKGTTTFTNINIRGKLFDDKIDTKLKTGWISVDKEEQYIYAKPIKETFTGKLRKLSLSSNPTHGAPIIVEVIDNNATPISPYQEIAFSDSATPGDLSFYNTEILKPKMDNSFYLGYKNTYDLSIRDLSTGELVATNLSATPNMATPPSGVSLNNQREYQLGYKVHNSYYIDTESVNDKDITSIYFDATPNYNYTYNVTYETSDYEMATPISVDLNPLTSWLDEGYIAVVTEEYNFSSLQINVSPKYVINDGKDYIDVSVVSLDINGNPKPYQTLSISGSKITPSVSTVTTDEEGYAHFRATSNQSVSVETYGTITISKTGYSKNILIEILPETVNSGKSIKAEVSNKIIKSDGVSNLFINGLITNNGVPVSNSVIYWRKSRTNYQLFTEISYSTSELTPLNSRFSGIVYSDSQGRFSIGPIVSTSRNDPGYWFIAVESEFSSNPTTSPSTIEGDIVYWLEDYDAINYNFNSGVGINEVVNYDASQSWSLYATPNFKVNYANRDQVDIQNTVPRWTPPKWFTVSRYDQYQSGMLGSTPYYIENYDSLVKDYEEE
jgi:hypothetical protein